MSWRDSKRSLADLLRKPYGIFKITGEETPEALRTRQKLRLWMGVGMGCLFMGGVFGLLNGSSNTPAKPQREEKPEQHHMNELSTPLSSINEGDLWVSRIQNTVKDYRQQLEELRSITQLQDKRIEELTKALSRQAMDSTGQNNSSVSSSLPELQAGSTQDTQHFPKTQGDLPQTSGQEGSTRQQTVSTMPPVPKGALLTGNSLKGDTPKKKKLLHLTSAILGDHTHSSPDTYLPAGTYFKIITAMGVVVSTGTNSSSDPQPILLRIVDNGNLPGGLKSIVKDAVLIGACYGSASAERAICRLKTLSWRDKSGRTIEREVSGWISSEDGVHGIAAKIIDRSSEIAREAFGAGLLSAAANFLKFEATSSVYPASPFGQSRAMPSGDALTGAAASGVGSALDKLAAFSIARAESMSPVAYVASGRVLDAVLMSGVDISSNPTDSNSLQMTSAQHNEPALKGETQ